METPTKPAQPGPFEPAREIEEEVSIYDQNPSRLQDNKKRNQ